jgi:HEAT repeat protein
MDAEQALPLLKRVLTRREPCTQRLRRMAVWLIASRKPADAAEVLLNVAKTDPDKEVREQAVFWIANVPTEEATTMLIELAKKGDDLELRRRAVYSLSRSKSPRAATTLKDIALDNNAEMELREDALTWYLAAPAGAADAITFLKDMYGRVDEPRLKQRVLYAISTRRTDESRAFLLELAQNPKESMDVRRSAIYSLQSAGITGAQLGQVYDRGADVELRRQLIAVLAMLKDNSGVDKLLDIARNEKNAELRKQAIASLTRANSKDPRVLALLKEIIEK